MIEISRILCPVDFSEFSHHAFDHALAIATWYEATVTVLYVVPRAVAPLVTPDAPLYPPIVFSPEDIEQFRREAEEFVATETAGVQVTTIAREGSAVGEIVDMAASLPADLITMGTHGRSGFDRLMMGSVTERVLRRAPCPVLTVPRRATEVSRAPVVFTRIVCGVDFSPCSMKGLTYAVALAEEADAELVVVHVLEHHVLAPTPMPATALPSDASVKQARLEQLRAAIPGEARTYARIQEMVLTGKPYREILRFAEERRAELIVIGAHGGDIGALAFGSTTNQVVRQAPCPVLTLKP
jgi:nucleotide-binding universal stress UspA family protein